MKSAEKSKLPPVVPPSKKTSLSRAANTPQTSPRAALASLSAQAGSSAKQAKSSSSAASKLSRSSAANTPQTSPRAACKAARSLPPVTEAERRRLYQQTLSYFQTQVPVAESELIFSSPYQLIVAVVLSAQCTDKRVNTVTPALFERYPDFVSLASASFTELFALIGSISYPRSKAQHLIDLARRVCTQFGGELPRSRSELMSLSGVGQKTANVVSSILWGEAVIAVDTHVFRVARRLGLSDGRSPLEVERDLEANIPPELRPIAHHWLILHGRYTCTARSPQCPSCPLSEFCPKRLSP